MKKEKIRAAGKEAAALVLGSFLYAAGFLMFVSPASLLLGGATGIATAVHIVTGFPVGVGILLCNIPLVVWGVAATGVRKMLRTAIGILAVSASVDLFFFLPTPALSPWAAVLLGGVLTGAGIGILLSVGYTTGGSDLAATLIHRRARFLSLGKWILLIDSAIVLLCSLLLGESERLFYSVLLNAVFSVTADAVVGGARKGKLAVIISERSDLLAGRIADELSRGVTELAGYGHYSGAEKRLLLCAVKRDEIYRLKNLVRENDPGAFVIVTEAEEILGAGFDTETLSPRKKRGKRMKERTDG